MAAAAAMNGGGGYHGGAAAAAAPAAPGGSWDPDTLRQLKVNEIFRAFDRNADGGLNRQEMASLVIAVNPRVKFKEEQIEAILDEVFRTYSEFILDDTGLSMEGLQRTYDDGAGDVDRDFDALRLSLPEPPAPPPEEEDQQQQMPPAQIAPQEDQQLEPAQEEEDTGGFRFLSTKRLVVELEALLAQHRSRTNPSEVTASNILSRKLEDLRSKADTTTPDPAAPLEAHMAFGRMLLAVARPEEACRSFLRAVALEPMSVRAHFLLGNAYYSMGKLAQARDAYSSSLEAGRADPEAHATILPQVHVNYGIVLEDEGLLMGACDHYREAAMLNPHHHRAMKLLGSALLGLGDHRAAEEALQNALYLQPDYADAHCDLGSTLHALGDDTRAGQHFERALSIDPDHISALYNYAGLLRDTGAFHDAVEHYSRVLAIDPDHWQAQLNRAISLLGEGKGELAQQELEATYRRTNRVELYDTVKQLKRLYKQNKKMSLVLARLADGEAAEAAPGGAGQLPPAVEEGSYAVLDPSKIGQVGPEVTPPRDLALALDVRAYQRHTKLSKCRAAAIRQELSDSNLEAAPRERMVRKAAVEQLLRNFLPPTLPGETFQQALRALNEKVISLIETSAANTGPAAGGVVDLGLFLALIALLCMGDLSERKAVAFEALQWRRGRPLPGTPLIRRDADNFLQLVRQVYLPGEPEREVGDAAQFDSQEVHFEEFSEMVDEAFPILDTLLKLESFDRVRHIGMSCAVCRYAIVGLRYREAKAKFDLCATCYSECKVPASRAPWRQHKQCTFGEYVGGTDKVRETFGLRGKSMARTFLARAPTSRERPSLNRSNTHSGGGRAESSEASPTHGGVEDA